jgi:hypothetical protein
VPDVVDFLTSKTGVFAAAVALIGLVASFVSLVKPALTRMREKREGRALLTITQPHLSGLSASSNSYDLRFEIANTGGGPAVALAVRLRIIERAPSTVTVPTITEAPLRVNQHRVKLEGDKDVYDIRARTYGATLPPLSFGKEEVEAFVVKLVSDEPQRYTARVEVNWYQVKTPSDSKTSHSETVVIEFPPRERSGKHR